LVDLPDLAPVDQPTTELHDFRGGADHPVAPTGELTLTIDEVAVTIDLAALARPGWQ